MNLQEEQHVCESCKKTLSLDEATQLFEEGELIGIAEEEEVKKLEEEHDEGEIVVSNLDEDIAALTEGEELSEEFKSKAATIIETAVKSRVKAEVKRIEEAYAEKLDEAIADARTELEKKVDGYLAHVVNEWLEANKPTVENGIKAKMNEEFLDGLATLLKEHYVKVPDDRWDLVEELANKVEDLSTKLDEEIEKNIQATATIFESEKKAAFAELAEGLADTQVEKLTELAESVDADNIEDYKSKVSTLKESYFKKTSGGKPAEELEEEAGSKENKGSPSGLIEQTLRLLKSEK